MEMEKEAAGPGVAGEQGQAAGVAGEYAQVAPPRRSRKDRTPAEQKAVDAFLSLVAADAMAYLDMTEEEVEDQYRRAGKLHLYDPDMELCKRYARIAKRFPPPDGFDPRLPKFLRLIEGEDEEPVRFRPGMHIKVRLIEDPLESDDDEDDEDNHQSKL